MPHASLPTQQRVEEGSLPCLAFALLCLSHEPLTPSLPHSPHPLLLQCNTELPGLPMAVWPPPYCVSLMYLSSLLYTPLFCSLPGLPEYGILASAIFLVRAPPSSVHPSLLQIISVLLASAWPAYGALVLSCCVLSRPWDGLM